MRAEGKESCHQPDGTKGNRGNERGRREQQQPQPPKPHAMADAEMRELQLFSELLTYKLSFLLHCFLSVIN